MGASYQKSGVSIDSGNNLVDKIKPVVKSTSRAGSNTDIGGFGGLFDLKQVGYKDPILVAATDGVGTKLKIANIVNKHNSIGIDLVAMCVNDLIVQGAEPLFFLDYFACGKLDIDQTAKVIEGVADGCKQANCALIGGETAEMPGMYKLGDYDLAGFSVGAVERDKVLPSSDIKEGDIIFGLPSSGVHSNGFSLVRYIIKENNLDYSDNISELGKSLGEALLEPTKIYVKTCMSLMKKDLLKGLSHITGGGLTENLPRVLPDNITAELDCKNWELPNIFKWIKKTGDVSNEEMLRVFNSGIGMALIVSADKKDEFINTMNDINESFFEIGKLIASDDNEDDNEVVFKNIENFCE